VILVSGEGIAPLRYSNEGIRIQVSGKHGGRTAPGQLGGGLFVFAEKPENARNAAGKT
jgi:hypothetical protein